MFLLLLIVPFMILMHKGDFSNCQRGFSTKPIALTDSARPYCEIWAKRGNVKAQLILGTSGAVMESHAAEGYYWLNQAANNIKESSVQGKIYTLIGDLNFNGFGTAKNYNLAFIDFTRSAQLGDNVGQYHLSKMYAESLGVMKNESQANWWLIQSAVNGNQEAKKLIRKRNLKIINYDTHESLYFDELFIKANHGDGLSQSIVATMIYSGIHIPKDNQQAYFYALKSAQQNNVQGQLILSKVFRQKNWIGYSESQAQYWFNLYQHNSTESLLKVKVD